VTRAKTQAIVVGLALAALTALTAPPGHAQTDVAFVSAMHTDETHVSFQLADFPWRENAPRQLRQISTTSLNRSLEALIRGHEDDFGFASVPFDVRVPADLRSKYYVLVDANGLAAMKLDRLQGVARIPLPDGAAAARDVQFYGDAIASPRQTSRKVAGGFILVTSTRAELAVRPSARTADDLLGVGGVEYFGRGTPFRSIRAQYELRIASDPSPYVFIQWIPDDELREAGCQYRFTLFKLTPQPTVVSTTDYACDV
jgi:hypothetical protein